ncbi:integrase, partial [Candidatus Liberibacter solanacearum]
MDHYLEKAIQNSGNVDYKKITSKHIRNALDERKNKLGATLNFFRAMQSLFKWATSNEYVAVNPCSGVDKPKNKSEGFKPWTKEDMIQFRDYWKEGSIPRLAFEFLFFTGLRSSDACRAGQQHLKGNVFSIKTQKVGTIVTIELP